MSLRSRRQANKQKRQERRAKRQESRGRRKDARLKKREDASLRRTALRGARAEARANARNQRKIARISKRNAKRLNRIYGDMSPEEVNEINQIAPYTGAMADELEQKGIPIENEDDPIEIASKYVQTSDEMGDPIDQDVYDDMYVNDEEDFESHFDYAKAKNTAGRALKGAFGGVLAEFGKYTDELKTKKRSGQDLSDNEEKILNAEKKARGFVKEQVKGDIMGTITELLPIILLAIVLMYALKNAN